MMKRQITLDDTINIPMSTSSWIFLSLSEPLYLFKYVWVDFLCIKTKRGTCVDTLSAGHRGSLSLPGWVQIFLFELRRLLVFHRKDECKGKFSRIEDVVVNSWTTILLVPLTLFWQQLRKWIQILLNPDLIVAFEGEFQILHDLLWA